MEQPCPNKGRDTQGLDGSRACADMQLLTCMQTCCKQQPPMVPHLAVACTFWAHIHSGKVVGPVSIGHDAWHIDQILTDAVMKGILQ